jgi:plasmid stabilization system protein ParE
MGVAVSFTLHAQHDLEKIGNFMFARNRRAAHKFRFLIAMAVARLALYPYMGKSSGVPGALEIGTGHYPYKIYYRVTSDGIEILHVRHASRDDPRSL